MDFQSSDGDGWQRAGAALRRQERVLFQRISERNQTRDLVTRAIEEDRVLLALQPVVFSRSPHVTAFREGLVRIALEDGTVLSPGAVLPKIAGLAQAAQLDIAVLRLALTALAQDPALRLSVNVSPATISLGGWLEVLAAMHAEAPELCYRLIVEITETANLAENDHVCAFIEAVRRTGANIALDDFGAGQTAFRYFRELRFDMVKIDGAFCHGLARDRDAQCLVRALVGVAQHFEMVSVAEHITNAEDAQMAQDLGVDCLQGHFYGAAMVPNPARPAAVNASPTRRS
ncbi:MAG: EAL domain-containing protein [Pseudomonadota bacterium]